MFEQLSFLFLAVCYLIVFCLYFINFESNNEAFQTKSTHIALLVMTLHLCLLICFVSHKPNFAQNHTESMIAFLIVLIGFFVETRLQIKSLMLFCLPISVLLLMIAGARIASYLHAVDHTPPALGWLLTHVGLIIAGVSGIFISTAFSVMYVIESSLLKSKKVGRVFFKFPALEKLDRMHFRFLSLGVILFSLGVLSGLFWANDVKRLSDIPDDPKVVLSFLTCLVYWMILSFRISSLRRGQRIAAGTLLGLLLVFVTLFSSHTLSSFIQH